MPAPSQKLNSDPEIGSQTGACAHAHHQNRPNTSAPPSDARQRLAPCPL